MVRIFSHIIVLHLCFTLTILLKFATSQDYSSTGYLNGSCSDDTHFQQGSEFQINLRYLLYNFTSNSDTQKFYNFTAGDASNRVYGLYLCYSFVDNQLCQSCVQAAADGILQRCPSNLEAIVWYDYCMLRYANHSIFSINDVSIHRLYSKGSNEYSRFRQQLSNSFLGLFDVATARCLTSKSAITIGFLDRRRIVLVPTVDCTPDISASDCRTCLSTGLDRLLTDIRQTGVLLQPSCQLTYTFDTESLLSAERNKKLHIGMGVISAIAATSLIVIVFLIYRLKRKKTRRKPNGLEEIESMDSLHIEFDTIKAATYNFSDAYQLGKGGFGTVYMGTLSDGQAVAVKRLSNASGQGIKEFKTEACLAAKLQHKNLVKVYGYCLEGNEMLLVYEFLPNKSLDRFLFDAKRGAYLKWETRYKIIVGVARGVQYLHEDSSPKIIHRDLKPSNILLDGEMNPKIADFGMARLFGGDQTQGNTSKIAGTFGYMAPEYGARGRYSIKSDVFSFGIILLEIVSGSGNLFLDPTTQEEGLLKYAWRLWNEGKHLNLVDATLGDNISRDEAERCIQVGLLCTQEDPAKRPSMASVLIMLNTHLNIELPLPSSPSTSPYEHERTSNSNGIRGIPIGDIISELSPR